MSGFIEELMTKLAKKQFQRNLELEEKGKEVLKMLEELENEKLQ